MSGEYKVQCMDKTTISAIVGMFSLRLAEFTAIGESVLPWNRRCWNGHLGLEGFRDRIGLGGN